MSLRVELDGPLCWVTLDRPEALNAISWDVMAQLEALLTQLHQGFEPVRVVIVRGSGQRAFASGGDLREFAALKSAAQAEQMARRMRAILEGFEALDRWTIACINGDAYGGGCELLCAMDLRVASTHARLGFTQARFDLTPGWGGLTRLVELVGRPRALRWLGTCAVISATQAHEAGLVDELCSPSALLEGTRELALRLAKQDRALIGALKGGALRACGPQRAASIEAELEPFARQWAGQEHHDRVARFLARAQDPEP